MTDAGWVIVSVFGGMLTITMALVLCQAMAAQHYHTADMIADRLTKRWMDLLEKDPYSEEAEHDEEILTRIFEKIYAVEIRRAHKWKRMWPWA